MFCYKRMGNCHHQLRICTRIRIEKFKRWAFTAPVPGASPPTIRSFPHITYSIQFHFDCFEESTSKWNFLSVFAYCLFKPMHLEYHCLMELEFLPKVKALVIKESLTASCSGFRIRMMIFKVIWNSHCSKSSFFVQKFNFDFPRKMSIFFWGEKLVKMLWFRTL